MTVIRPLPRGMAEQRRALLERRDQIEPIVRWLRELGSEPTALATELADLNRRIDGFARFENGE